MKYVITILCLVAFARVPQAQQQKPISLIEALAAAKANRPSVGAARFRLSSARLARRALGSYPATKLLIGYTDKEQIGGADDDLVLVQPIDIFGNTSALRSIGDAGVERAEAELQQVLSDLQNQVIEQFSEAAAAKALSESAAQLQELAQRLHDAIKILVEEGKLPGVHLARVAIELERAHLTADQRAAELKASLQTLGGILNLPPDQLSVSGFSVISMEIIDSRILQRSRADLRLLASEVSATQAETRVASIAGRPEIEIQGRQTSWHSPHKQYGMRIQLGIPLFDFGKVRTETASARAKTEAAKKTLEDATRFAQIELKVAQFNLESAQKQVSRYASILASTRALVEKSRIGFTEKAITLVELLEASRALREVEEGYIESQLKFAKAQATYIRASGKILEAGK